MLNEILGRQPEKADVYVDGAYDNDIKHYSFGVYIIFDNNETLGGYGAGCDPRYQRHTNMAGELMAAVRGIEMCLRNNVRNIDIYYDYIGIEKYANRKLPPKSQIADEYIESIEKYRESGVLINFTYVKSHSSNRGNTIADKLAKRALREVRSLIEEGECGERANY